MIHTIFFHLCLWCLDDAVKSVSVMEGDYVTLNTDAAEIQRDKVIEWRFGHNDILIARINRQNNERTIYNGSADGKFRDRLKLDEKTGSLTITNTRTTDSGLYKVTSSRTETPLNTFNLTIYGEYPLLVITRFFTQCPSSSHQN
ncbi:hypothetical protein PO909_028013 [Leuciscus waleckii]